MVDDTSQSASEANPNASDKTTVTTGGFRGAHARRKRKKTLVYALVVAGIIIVVLGYVLFTQLFPKAKDQSQADPSQASADFSVLERDQIPTQIERVSGVSLEDLQNKPITRSVLPTFAKAHGAAQGLDVLGDRKHSAVAYSVADSLLSDSDLGELEKSQFYVEYAIVSARLKETEKATRFFDTAQKLVSESTLGEESKDEALNKIATARKTWVGPQ